MPYCSVPQNRDRAGKTGSDSLWDSIRGSLRGSIVSASPSRTLGWSESWESQTRNHCLLESCFELTGLLEYAKTDLRALQSLKRRRSLLQSPRRRKHQDLRFLLSKNAVCASSV